MVWHIYRELSLFTVDGARRQRIIVVVRLCICRSLGLSSCLSVCLSFWRSSILKFVLARVFQLNFPTRSLPKRSFEMVNLLWGSRRTASNYFLPRSAQQVNISDEGRRWSVPLNVSGGWLISPWTSVVVFLLSAIEWIQRAKQILIHYLATNWDAPWLMISPLSFVAWKKQSDKNKAIISMRWISTKKLETYNLAKDSFVNWQLISFNLANNNFMFCQNAALTLVWVDVGVSAYTFIAIGLWLSCSRSYPIQY